MPGERDLSADDHSEKLNAARVTITRKRGLFSYSFEIDGYVGERTGRIYYKGSEVKRVEDYLNEKEAIREYDIGPWGLVLSFETQPAVFAVIENEVPVAVVQTAQTQLPALTKSF